MNTKILFAVVVGLLFTVLYYVRHPLTTKVQIRGVTYFVEIAATDSEKERGLGYRNSLGKNAGMLFPYGHTEQFSYWMKGMRFPIDIIWIRDNQIVDISKNVPIPSGSQLPIYKPNSPVNKVLEVQAGESDAHSFAPGDLVRVFN